MKLKALDNGQIINKTVKSGTKRLNMLILKQKEFNIFTVMIPPPTSWIWRHMRRINIPKDVIGSYLNFLKEGDSILILSYEGKVLTVKENSSVVLEVTTADDAVKGNTANSATKLVTVETGYQLHVPLFIKTGDKIKINTETGEYSGKSN